MEKQNENMFERLNKLELVVVQVGNVINKMSNLINTITGQMTSLVNSVYIIQKEILEYRKAPEYII